MSEPNSIGILDALHEQKGFYAAIFFTYGVDLAFFEEAVLPPLWDSGCRRSLIFMDARRYADTIRDWRGSVTWAGLRYILVPVDLGKWQSFHPKMALLLGDKCARMLIGSGNLTFTGFGHNQELYTCLDWTPEAPLLASVFADAWSLVKRVTDRWAHSHQVRETLDALDYLADWVAPTSAPPTDIKLIHTMDEPLLDQCAHRLNSETVQSLMVMAPFIDRNAQALRQLHQHLQPKELVIVVQNGQTSGDTGALQELLTAGAPLKIRLFEGDPRYLHAKAYLVRTAHGCYLLTGSANCTKSAWLSTYRNGNMEMMLLRYSSAPSHFDYLLQNRIGTRSVGFMDAFELQTVAMQPGDGHSTCLLDLTVKDERLFVKLSAAAIPEGIRALELRLSTVPTRCVPLGPWQAGISETQVDIAPELREVLQKPLSATLWGVGQDGEPVDLRSNELWITNVDRLRREIRHPLPQGVRTAGYFREMALGSEEDWRDLYDALEPLLMLDVADLRRRGAAYTTSPPSSSRGEASDSEEREGKVQLLDEAEAEAKDPIAAQRYYESALHAWLEHVHARLPGTGGRETDTAAESGRPDTPGATSVKRTAGRWTPSQRITRRFRNLITKYIGSLGNKEYMRAIGVRHILTYYVVFQRVVQLLHQHGGLGDEDARLLAMRINEGFFGPSATDAPVLIVPQQRYVDSAWEKDWLECQVPAYALASIIVRCAGSTRAKGRPDVDCGDQALRVIGCVATVVGLQRATTACETSAEVAQAFQRDPQRLAQNVRTVIQRSLPETAVMLRQWTRSVVAEAQDGSILRKERCRARVDYSLAHFETLVMLGDFEGQRTVWPDLVSWMHVLGERAASQWDRLVEVASAAGDRAGLCQTLFTHGQRLFYDGRHEESAKSLRRALHLAAGLQDEQLKASCQEYLGYCGFFLSSQDSAPKHR